jgi:hypothetical protein
MERHYQHTSPFPPEFRTTHNFFTKEVFVMPLHPAIFGPGWRGARFWRKLKDLPKQRGPL